MPATDSRSAASSSVGTSVRVGMFGTLCQMPTPVFDGHNDALLRAGATELLAGRPGGHLDVPRARAGGFAGGIFAVFTPGDDLVSREDAAAHATVHAGRLFELESLGGVRVVRSVADLEIGRA